MSKGRKLSMITAALTVAIMFACFYILTRGMMDIRQDWPIVYELDGFRAEKIGDSYGGQYADQDCVFYRVSFSTVNTGTTDLVENYLNVYYKSDEGYTRNLYKDYNSQWGDAAEYLLPVGRTALVEQVVSVPASAHKLTACYRPDSLSDQEEQVEIPLE